MPLTKKPHGTADYETTNNLNVKTTIAEAIS